MKKRILSLLMALAICLSMLPTAALAEELTAGAAPAQKEQQVPEEPKPAEQPTEEEQTDEEQETPPVPPAPQNGEENGEAVTGSETESYAAEIGDAKYATLPAALEAAQNGATVKLLANHVTDGKAVTEGNFSTMAIVKKQLTLDLNGFFVDNLYVGWENEDDETGETIVTDSGELTVVDDSAGKTGSIFYLDLISGKLTIEGGTMQELDCESGTVTITGGANHGDKNVWSIAGTLNIDSGDFGNMSFINNSGGKITITNGTFGEVSFNSHGGITAISGGSFKEIANSDASHNISVISLLAEGYVFYGKDAEGQYTVVKDGTAVNLSDVEVKQHSHTMDDGKCACGVEAIASLTAGETTTYYTDFGAAIGAATESKGSTVKLYQNVTLPKDNSVYLSSGTFTIDWNGHTLTGNTWRNLLTISGRANVTLQDSSANGTGGVRNKSGVAVGIFVDSIGSATITGGTYSPQVIKGKSCYGSIRISGGVFENPMDSGKNSALYNEKSDGKLIDMLAPGYTFASDAQGNTLLDVYATKDSVPGNTVYVVAHSHSDFDDAAKCACGYTCTHTEIGTDNNCTTCGKPMAATVTKGSVTKAYETLAEALASAENGSTVTLLTNAEEITVSKKLKLDLNDHTVNELEVTGDLTLSDLLPQEYGFKSNDNWLTVEELLSKSASNVTMAETDVAIWSITGSASVPYGTAKNLGLSISYRWGHCTYQWYELKDGTWAAITGATKDAYNTPTDLSIGTHMFRCAVKDYYGAAVLSDSTTVTVTRAAQSGTVSMAGYTYNGTVSTPSLTDKVGDGAVTYYYSTANATTGGTEWRDIKPNTLDAGTYYMYAVFAATENYNAFTTDAVKFEVAKATPSYTVPTGLTAAYGQKLSDITLPAGWSWMDSNESVGDASTTPKSFKAKFTPANTTNYIVVENIKVEVTVNRADQKALTIRADATSMAYGQKLQLSTTGGSGSGAVTYTVTAPNNGGGYADIDDNGVLTPIEAGTIMVTATKAGDNNYNAATSAPFVITIKRATPTGTPGYTPIKGAGKTLADVALSAMDGDASRFKFGDEDIHGEVYFVDDNGARLALTTPVEKGKAYRWVFTPNNDYERNFNGLSGTITPWEDSGTVIIVPTQPTENGNVSNPSTGAATQGGIACGMAVLVAAGICILGGMRKNREEQ